MYTDCKIIILDGYVFIYKGLIDKTSGLPALIGRAIHEEDTYFYDGIFECGVPKDIGRFIFEDDEESD